MELFDRHRCGSDIAATGHLWGRITQVRLLSQEFCFWPDANWRTHSSPWQRNSGWQWRSRQAGNINIEKGHGHECARARSHHRSVLWYKGARRSYKFKLRWSNNFYWPYFVKQRQLSSSVSCPRKNDSKWTPNHFARGVDWVNWKCVTNLKKAHPNFKCYENFSHRKLIIQLRNKSPYPISHVNLSMGDRRRRGRALRKYLALQHI